MKPLVIQHLQKNYGKKIGLSDFSLELDNGILGLLGPNGAGKSTLMKMLATISKPSSGSILLNGSNIVGQPDDMRKVLGYLPQDFGVYPNLNAIEFLEYMAAIKGLGGPEVRKRIEVLLENLNLASAAKKAIGTYSGGMKQRIGIAQALLNDPKVLIFDEPTVGLDPEERVRFRGLIADLAGDRIVILSSHIVSDIETIADEIVIMKDGKLLVHNNLEGLIKQADHIVFETVVPDAALADFKKKYKIIETTRQKASWQVRFLNPQQVHESGFVEQKATLEDVYLSYTL